VDHDLGLVGLAVYDAISTIVEAGRQIEGGTNGIAGGLASAGHGAQQIPLVGDEVSKPLTSASHAASISRTPCTTWTPRRAGSRVARGGGCRAPHPASVLPWLFLRLRFFRRKWVATGLAATPPGRDLLALRALTNRSPHKLCLSEDPVGGWRRGDPGTIQALVALELRSAGSVCPRAEPQHCGGLSDAVRRFRVAAVGDRWCSAATTASAEPATTGPGARAVVGTPTDDSICCRT